MTNPTIQHDDDLTHAAAEADPLGAFYFGVFLTAMEGGVNYWGTVTVYKWRTKVARADGETVYVDDLRGFKARVYDAEAEPTDVAAASRVVDRRVVTRGCRALAKLDTHLGRTMAKALAAKDAGDIDADGADAAVQMGLFGEVVYG